MLTVARVTASYTRDGKLISRKIEPIEDKNFISGVVEILGKGFMKYVDAANFHPQPVRACFKKKRHLLP